MSYPLLGMPQGAEWFIILAIVILVFGAAKLPDLARSTGQALKIFKSETKGLIDEDGKDKDGNPSTTAAPAGELPPASSATEPVAGPVQPTDTSTTPSERHPG